MKLQGRENGVTGKIDVFLTDEGGQERFLESFDTPMEAREYAVSFRNGVQTLTMMAEAAPEGDFAAGFGTSDTIVVPEKPADE